MEQEDQPPLNLCTCEDVPHGELGAIDNDEDLARVIMSPTHFNKKGELKPGAFPLSHISKTGLSLLRVHKMSKQDIVSIAAGITPSSQSAHSIAVASALQIRAIGVPQGARALCVLDDPVENDPHAPDNPAHAIAISSLDRSQEEFEPDVLEIQTELLHLFRRTLKRLPDEI